MQAKLRGVIMVGIFKGFALGCVAGCLAWGADTPRIEYKPLAIYGLQEFGQIRDGAILTGGGKATLLKNEWLDHFGAFVTQEAFVDRKVKLQVGLGGIFEFPKDERKEPQFGGTQGKMFFIGPTTANAMVLFGDPENPWLSLGGGMFPFKYNPDASDLGEYLFRSGGYPTHVFNGGYLLIGDNKAYLEGCHALVSLGNLKLDLLFTTETRMPPLYDWSLSSLAQYSMADGLIDMGAGVKFDRLLQVRPSRTMREEIGNSYFQRPDGKWYSGNASYYSNQQKFWEAKIKNINPLDTLAVQGAQKKIDANKGIYDSINPDAGGAWINSATKLPIGAKFYTPAGVIVMGRMSVDLKKLFNSPQFSPSDLRIYSEVALLGVGDYPVFYEKKSERMPIMVGINLPTLGVLDLFSVQVEHFGLRFENSTYQLGASNYAIPYFPSDPYYSQNEYGDLADKDNWSWSILLKKSVFSAFNFSAQFAKDHYRTVSSNYFTYGPHLEPGDVTHKLSDWYCMVQFGWGI